MDKIVRGATRLLLVASAFSPFATLSGAAVNDYYDEPQVYGMRPNPNGEWNLGPIGATGIRARIYKGVTVAVEETDPGSPAHGKFTKGDIILGVNGTMHKGKNPLVVFGTALTQAEATDGVLVFDVLPGAEGKARKVTVKIPVLGAYSKTFPLKCEKSDRIIKRAAEFYAAKDRLKAHNMWNALACLFLLSTGDEAYVPRVKTYFAQFLEADGSVKGIGDHSWFNGYNGIACAEYYLRSGDKSVLPILQHYCDDARDRQKYGVGWPHWGYSANPSYESGGGMQHAAGTQILATLVLGKMCGVKVDEKTLVGALTHWYRFAGHGTIPVSDQRPYHIFRSAGRDGGTAAIMQVATHAKGDVAIYEKAKDYLAMSALTSWPERHYDWEVYWHSLAGHFVRDKRPDLYQKIMDRFRWRYDLGRDASGGFSWPERSGSKDETEAGICLALAYTAPLRTLQITGAPRSTYAKAFSLPERLWGTEADLAFLTSEHNKDFSTYGAEEDMHILFHELPIRLRYGRDATKELSLGYLQKHVRHARCTVRRAAAKGLCLNGHLDEIEKLMSDPDPRLRLAGLDGINDCRPWFTGPVVGEYALLAEDYTPAMISSINRMMSDPKESWAVIDGALNALGHAPVEVIEKNMPYIIPWTTSTEWWLRESAFVAMMGLQSDEDRFVEYLPKIIDVMIAEYVYNPRHKMVMFLKDALLECGKESPAGTMIVAGFARAALESEVRPDIGRYPRSAEGTANILEVALMMISEAPEEAADLAEALVRDGRLEGIDTDSLMKIVRAPDGHVHDRFVGLYPALKDLPEKDRARVVETLYNAFRPELLKRLEADSKPNSKLLDMVVDLTSLKKEIKGWQKMGVPAPNERSWRFLSFDPLKDAETLHPRVGPPDRLRDVTLPDRCDNWYMPDFDDSTWQQGKSPIGIGDFKAHGHGRGWTYQPDFSYTNSSDWGEREFLMMRTSFEVKDPDFDFYRISILADQGYHIYLNGHKIHTYVWFMHRPEYRHIMLTAKETRHLKKGTNTLAAFGVVRFEKNKQTEAYHHVGQMDLWLEGLKKKDIGL